MYNLKLDQLKSLHEIIIGNEVFQHKITMSKGKRGEKRYYHIYNQLSACFVRIRETCHYLSDFHFRKSNICGQAFDFYEFVNCISIILGCVENLFGVFNVQLNDYYKSKKVFFKSNKTKQNDIKFFKFIRSASAVHPSETTNYNKITKLKFEVYPYALWAGHLSMFLLDNIPQDFDIELIGWNSRTNSYNNYYYLYINEFYDFVNELLASITVRKRFRKNGETMYEYRFEIATVDGKRQWKTKCGFKTATEARKAGRLDLQTYENAGRVIAKDKMSVSDYFAYWISADCEIDLKPTTIMGYRKTIENLILPKLGSYRLKSLTREILQAFLLELYDAGYSQNTLVKVKAILSKSMNYAVDHHYIPYSPAVRLKSPKNRRP